jgi:competence protein ComEA
MRMTLDHRQRRLLSAVAVAAGLGLRSVAIPAGGPDPARVELVVDPNTAPPEVLTALPRLGPTLVDRIVDARAVTPFTSLNDLDDRVQGIGPATISILRPYLRVGITPAAFTDP